MRKNLLPESVWCVLIFEELSVLPPEIVMHIVSFLTYLECERCGAVVADNLGTHSFLCTLREQALEDIKLQNVYREEVIRRLLQFGQ